MIVILKLFSPHHSLRQGAMLLFSSLLSNKLIIDERLSDMPVVPFRTH